MGQWLHNPEWQRQEALNDCHQIPEKASGQKPLTDSKRKRTARLVAAATAVSVSTVRQLLNIEGVNSKTINFPQCGG